MCGKYVRVLQSVCTTDGTFWRISIICLQYTANKWCSLLVQTNNKTGSKSTKYTKKSTTKKESTIIKKSKHEKKNDRLKNKIKGKERKKVDSN